MSLSVRISINLSACLTGVYAGCGDYDMQRLPAATAMHFMDIEYGYCTYGYVRIWFAVAFVSTIMYCTINLIPSPLVLNAPPNNKHLRQFLLLGSFSLLGNPIINGNP